MSNSFKHPQRKEESKGHNHPASQKCGLHCPRNEKYKGRERKVDPFHKNK